MKFNKILMLLILLLTFGLFAQDSNDKYSDINWKELSDADAERILGDMYAPKFFKSNGDKTQIKELIVSGNKITTILFNYGSICAPNRLSGTADLVWEGLGYGFEFTPLAASLVKGPDGENIKLVSDSYKLTTQGDYSESGDKWGWLPKAGYVDPDQDEIASLNAADKNGDGKPDSWPERWYSAGAQKYIWPAFLGDQASAPDEEVYFVVDDYSNAEFPYYPFDNDSTKRGLGLDMECRIIQFNNPLAEDALFLVYNVSNASDKTLDPVFFGMHGDPHIGGSSDYGDDLAGFVDASGFTLQPIDFPQRARNMVYAWDKDQSGTGGRRTGYFGWKFLESPSEDSDMEDNDEDGLTDESPENSAGVYIDGVTLPLDYGISDTVLFKSVFGELKPRFAGDEDGDWDPETDDIGIDGIGPDSPNYPGADYGEDDGKPSQAWYLDDNSNGAYDVGELLSDERLPGYKWAGSEPQFGRRDISESDQIGLTAFNAAQYTQKLPNVPMNDELMYDWLSAGKVDTAGQELLLKAGDNIFNFGTGPAVLEPGASQRFSMCIVFGSNINDLILNAETTTRILEADYRFAQPPAKPIVNAVAGDGKVTLYWDDRAESSVDPLTGKQDFMGYKIYRSRDYTFSDVRTITDGRGNAFLGDAFVNPETNERAQWHIVIPEDERSMYVNGFHPVEFQGRAVKYYIGDPDDTTGVIHEFVDSSVTNGIRYYYAVVAFDGGSIESGKELPPSETQSSISRDPITGKLTYDINTAMVMPGVKASNLNDADAGNYGIPVHDNGNATGFVGIKVLDELAVPDNKTYALEFTDPYTYSLLDSSGVVEEVVSDDTVFVELDHANIKEGTVVLTDAGGNVVDESKYEVNTSTGKIRGSEYNSLPKDNVYNVKYSYYPIVNSTRLDSSDGNPSFEGMKVYLVNEPLELNKEESKFSNPDINVKYEVIPATTGNPRADYRADWEIRWNNTDTTATGDWENVGDTALTKYNGMLAKCPFEIWITNPVVEKATYRVLEDKADANGKWDWGESLLIQPQGNTAFAAAYEVQFILPPDSVVSASNLVKPGDGDIFHIKTRKPFEANERYIWTTKAAKPTKTDVNVVANDIYVVPNPYVAYSLSEEPGTISSKRGERELQFRNLPEKCTIRIYTITGNLVDTIEKDDMTSYASWNLLSSEGQRIAYGVYIFHVDIPDVGEKLGRFAVIK